MNISGVMTIIGGRGPFTAELVDSDIPDGTFLVVTDREIAFDGDDVPEETTYTYTVRVTDTATGRTVDRPQVTAVGVTFVATAFATSPIGSGLVLSNENRTVTKTEAGTQNRVARSAAPIADKTYMEIPFNWPTGRANDFDGFGFVRANFSDYTDGSSYMGATAGSVGLYLINMRLYKETGTPGSTDYTDLANDTDYVGMMAVDPATGNYWFGIVGLGWYGGGDPETGTSPTGTVAGGSGDYYFAVMCSMFGNSWSPNFGQSPFAGTVPSGFSPGISA